MTATDRMTDQPLGSLSTVVDGEHARITQDSAKFKYKSGMTGSYCASFTLC